MSRPRLPATWALVGWTLLVWTTRIGNIWSDEALDTGDKLGRTALALSFTLLVVATAWALWRGAGWLGTAVRILAAWTVVVWVARATGIALGDHSASFVIVHLVLAVVSTLLAVLAVREVQAPRGVVTPAD